MVERIINFLNREINGLHKAAFLLGFFALGSQMLALLRDRLLAHIFGAGVSLDVYYAAFRIPDFIFITVGSIVSVSVIVPFFVDRINHSPELGKQFVDQVFSFFSWLILIVTGLVFLAAPGLLGVLFPDFTGENSEQLVWLTRLLLLSPILMGFSGLLGGISQSYKRFFLYALSPVLYNVGIIAGILTLAPTLGVMGVGVGVVVGAGLHLGVHLPFAYRQGMLPRFRWSLDRALVGQLVLTSLPRTFTLALTHLVLFVLIILASRMREGSISVFQFAFNLQSVPLSVIGVSYSLAAFSTLSDLFSKGQWQKFLSYVVASARHIIFWSIPVAVLFVVLRAQIVRVILGTGEFDWVATQLTAAALALFAISVVFQGLVLLFIRSFYAMGRTLIPLLIGVLGALVSIVSAYGLLFWFESSELFKFFIKSLLRLEALESGVEVILLALAYSTGIFVNALILWLAFQWMFPGFSRGVLQTLVQVLFASLGAGTVAYIGLNIYAQYFELTTTLSVFLQGVTAGLLAAIVGGLILWILGNCEIRSVWAIVQAKFWKSRIVGPDPDLM